VKPKRWHGFYSPELNVHCIYIAHDSAEGVSVQEGGLRGDQRMNSSFNLLSRRKLLQVGGIGMLGLPQLLQAEKAAAGTPAKKLSEKSCIFIFQTGGASQIDTWDLKPDAPSEIRGAYKPIATRVSGIQIGELMPQLAKLADRYSLIRSLTHSLDGNHPHAIRGMLSGQSKLTADEVSYGAVVAKQRPSTTGVSHVWLQKLNGYPREVDALHLTGGFLGARFNPLVVQNSIQDDPSAPGYRVKAFDFPAEISRERLKGRTGLLEHLDPCANMAAPAQAAYQSHQERALDLIMRPEALHAFDLEHEPATVRDRYGRHPLGQNLLMARRLIEAGVRLVGINAWTGGIRPGEKVDPSNSPCWDMHGGMGISIFDNGWNGLGHVLPAADQAVSALLEDLDQRGLLESTLVVMVGEFGRTPRLSRHNSPKGAIGRDHWPPCFSAMFAGAGIRGGMVFGASDKAAAYVKEAPVSPENFAATIFHALGVPLETRLSPDGFTRPVSTGYPVLELF
jgi:hypothetical protein